MRFRIFAALFAIGTVFPLYIHAQAGFIAVSQSKLSDASGNPANAQVCAQAVDPVGNAISVHVGGGGIATTSSVCTAAVAGAWTLFLPNTRISTPGNAGFNFTAVDNVTGSNLIGPGYNYVQPTSDPTSQWCSTTTAGITTCNFDNLLPMVKPTVQTIYQGPSGKDGATGPAGCVIGSTCAAVPLQQPTTDQFSNNTIYVYPSGDFGSRINAAYAANTCASQFCRVVLTKGATALPVLTTPIVIPSGSRFECDPGSGFTYQGYGYAVSMSGTRQYAGTGMSNCEIVGTAAGAAGFANGTSGIFGLSTSHNNIHGFTNGDGYRVGGGSVSWTSYQDAAGQNKYGFHGVTPAGSYGMNAATMIHPETGGNSKYGIYFDTGFVQNIHITDHVSEGDGLRADLDSGCAAVDDFQDFVYEHPYCEAQGFGGLQGIRIGGTADRPYTAVAAKVLGGIFQTYSGSIAVNALRGGVYFEDPTLSGNVGELAMHVGSGVTSWSTRGINKDSILIDDGAPESYDSTSPAAHIIASNGNAFGPGKRTFQQDAFTFAQGSCSKVSSMPGFTGTNFNALFFGQWTESSAGYALDTLWPINAGNPSITVGPATVTFSVNSKGQVCGTTSGESASGFVSFTGHVLLNDTTLAVPNKSVTAGSCVMTFNSGILVSTAGCN